MSFWNRHFLAGLVVGAAFPAVILMGAGLVAFVRTHSPAEVAHGNHEGGGELPTPPFPEPASVSDPDWKLLDLNGEETSFSAFRGKVLFVNRWATWCRPCVAEMPGIERLYERFSPEQVEFLAVSDEPPEVVRRFAGEQGWELPLYTSTEEAPSMFRSRGIPATFILDRQGRIAFQHVGSARWDDESSVRFLNRLLSE